MQTIAIDDSLNPVAELVSRALGADREAAMRFVDALRSRGLSSESICLDLVEPAARELGSQWTRDLCSELDVTLGVCRLQTLTRHLGPTFRRPRRAAFACNAVLVATQPGEPHMLDAALASECFWSAGWDVACEFPTEDDDLAALLQRRHFDVLGLSLSSAFTREHRLAAMARTIRCARAASLNPSLVVLVSGRMFFEHPEFGLLVGADAGCPRAGRAVALTDGLLKASAAFQATNRTLREVGSAISAQAWRVPARFDA